MGSSDADVAELAGHAQGDGAGLVDTVVGVVAGGPWEGLGHGVVKRCGRGPVWQGAVWAVLVVFGAEPDEQRLH